MNDLLRWALNLRSLSFDQEGVEFGFARPLPTWGWAIVFAAVAALAWWSYRRLEGSRPVRVALSLARLCILLLLVLLITGPRLIKPNESEEKDWVIVLADRSASMTIKDAPPSSADPAAPRSASSSIRVPRDAQLADALERSQQTWKSLAADRTLLWLGFDSGTFDLQPISDPTPAEPGDQSDALGASVPTGSMPINLGPALGRRTSIGRALDQALRRAAARPISGIVLFSDGRSIDAPTRAILRRLEAERIPVFAVPLGSPDPVTDFSIRRAEGPKSAFLNDFVPIEIEIDRLGVPSSSAAPAKAQLIDNATGAILDERELTFDTPADSSDPDGVRNGPATTRAASTRLTLTTKAEKPGSPDWSIRIVTSSPDLIEENNAAPVAVDLIERPLRVAYFDGYPRWEQRYVKQLLVRERSVRGTSMILASGRRFVQEGDEELTSLPRSPEEWRAFDAIILGDVRPELFTEEQLQQIKDHVSINGAGLVWIGGEGATPGAWSGTPLADLLPFVLQGADSAGLPIWPGPVTITPTPLADRLGVLRLLPQAIGNSWWPAELADPATGWNQFQWAQRLDPALLKPAVEVLAVARDAAAAPPASPLDSTADAQDLSAPILVSMRFGAGRVLYLATDEIWRWRYGRGELYAERFYLQILRMLGRESVSRAGKLALLSVSPPRAEVEQPIRVAVELIDQSLIDAAPASIRVRILRELDTPGPPSPVDPGATDTRPASIIDDSFAPVELVLLPESLAASTSRDPRLPRAARTFAATWIATEAGSYRVEAADSLLIGLGAAGMGGSAPLAAPLQIWLPDDELRRPETDHDALARLAQATGGSILSPRDLVDLPSLLPNRELRLAGEPDIETLWDTPLALILLLTLLTIEWIGRRLIRLA